MKLQIVHLEPHDDQVSARDKLRAVKADRALLVWPRHGRIIQSRLDLALLRREAETMGLQLGLLTHDPRVRDHADHEHIPVFDNLDRLPEERWQHAGGHRRIERPATGLDDKEVSNDLPERPQKSDRRVSAPPWASRMAVGLAILALAALVGALAPSARIVLAPPQTTQSRTLRLRLEPALASSDESQAALAANQVRVTLSASDRAVATGRQSVPAEKAQGSLLFTNLTQGAIELPVGTSARVSSDNSVYYQTIEPAFLPGEEGARVLVAAAASVPGRDGNTEANRVDAVDGPLGLDVTVTNPEAFEGGSDARQPSIRPADLDGLRQSVLDEIEQRAAEQLAAQLPEGGRLASESVTIVRVLSEAYDAGAGDLATSVGLSIEAEASGLVYQAEDLEETARQAAESTVGSGWQVVPGSVRLTLIRSDKRPDGGIEVEAAAHWRRARTFDRIGVANLVAGLTVPDARRRIGARSEFELLAIEVWPSWFPRLPWISARIAVEPDWERQ
ncbi:MAG: baseplate J/gp47 family protein [Anaerolineales bacterium]